MDDGIDWDDETGRDVMVEVELTDDELANIVAAADRAGMTVDGYIRRRCLDDEFRAGQLPIPANGNDA